MSPESIQTLARQYCTFWLDDHFFGISVDQVQEILRSHAMTPVPLAPDCVTGLINLRGQIMTAIDLRRRFRMPGSPEGSQPIIVVIRREDDAVGFLVDRIGDVVKPEPDSFEPVPDATDARLQALLLGVFKLERSLLLALDVDRVLELDERCPERGQIDGE